MTGPCVRVEREAGERTRSALAEQGLIDETREIAVDDGWLFVPIDDREAVPATYEVVERDLPQRATQTMPADLVDFQPSYERVGEVVIIDEDDSERARALADAIVASSLPAETVLNRASKVKGEERVREWDVLVGESTETVHREYGHAFAVDLAAVYFSPRLATERHRVIEQVETDERVFDMFAGVGPFVIPAAARGAETVGVDVNETAISYLRENARQNGVADRVTAINADVREVVTGSTRAEWKAGVDDHAGEYVDWADRIVMNLPHSADEFLDTAVALAGDTSTIHYYDIQHEDDPFGPGERAIRAAAEPAYEVRVETRHTVRSYAPHEVNVCLDVRLERA